MFGAERLKKPFILSTLMLRNPRISEHAEAWGLGYVLAITNGKGNVVLLFKVKQQRSKPYLFVHMVNRSA